MRSLYAGSDALLAPTYYDPCSLASLEAVACGTPVVTTAANGAADLIGPAGAGVIVEDPAAVPAMVRALQQISTHAEAYRKRARALRPQLAWERHLDRVEELLSAAMRPAAKR